MNPAAQRSFARLIARVHRIDPRLPPPIATYDSDRWGVGGGWFSWPQIGVTAAVDKCGWVEQMSAGTVTRYAPDGTELAEPPDCR